METTTIACIRCKGVMHEGFLVDSGMASLGVANWYAGPPKMRSFGRGLELIDKQLKRVAAYRCDRCSYLEFYAP